MIKLVSYESKYLQDMIGLFKDTVHTINRRDYTAKQVAIWAPKHIDETAWHESFCEHDTIIALKNSMVVGFIDKQEAYIDRLYVHKNYQGQGIASKLLEEIEAMVLKDKQKYLQVAVSITAKAFFLNKGYKIIRQQQIERQDEIFINFLMEKHF